MENKYGAISHSYVLDVLGKITDDPVRFSLFWSHCHFYVCFCLLTQTLTLTLTLILLNWITKVDFKPGFQYLIILLTPVWAAVATVNIQPLWKKKASSLWDGITGGVSRRWRGARRRSLRAGCGRSGVHTSFQPDLWQEIEEGCGLFVHLFAVRPPRGQFPSPLTGGRRLTRQLTRSESESNSRSKRIRRPADKDPR